LAAPDLACVAVLAPALRALVAVDFAPLRADACVAFAPVLRELLARAPPDRDEDDELVRPDDERLAGGIRKHLLLVGFSAWRADDGPTSLRRIYPMCAQYARSGQNVSA
jgi:hypothetical protein